jgi:hypothetical protein
LIGITKVDTVKFFDVLFYNAVNDALYSDGGDCLLELELFMESFHLLLEGQNFIGARLFVDFLFLCVVGLMSGANKVTMFLVTVA